MIRSCFKIHGGKSYLKKFIIENFYPNYPEMTYVEACLGGGSVFLNKIPSKKEIINDLDENIYDLYSHLKVNSQLMIANLNLIEYSEETFKSFLLPKNGINKAIREIVLRRMSRGGMKKHFSWSERKRGGQPGDKNAWMTFVKNDLHLICARLQNVEITNKHAIDLIKEKDGENTFIYIDPPYLKKTRTAQKVYDVEMTDGDHMLLAGILNEAKSKVMVSGYYSKEYSKLYKGWRMLTKEMPNHSSQSKVKQRRIECLWMNY